MNQLTDIIKSFEKVHDWVSLVKENFERRAGLYNYITVTELQITINGKQFDFPKKVTFENGYLKSLRDISQIERLVLNKNKVKIKETKKLIPLGFYQRTGRYSGEIFEIIQDILGDGNSLEAFFSSELLSARDGALYNIDSNQKWSSYILIFHERTESRKQVTTSIDEQISLTDTLKEYGISYNYSTDLKGTILVIFPMPYIKIVENKIKRESGKESIFLVLEFNQLSFFYANKSLQFEIAGIIKDINGDVIFQQNLPIKFGKSTYQVVEIHPETNKEIGFASLSVKINNIIVETFSGYYVRSIKINTKLM